MSGVVLAAILVGIALPSSLLSACLNLRSVKSEDPAEYMLTVIGSLGWLKSSLERRTPDDDLMETVRNMRTAQSDIKCGADSLKPFRSAKNKFISDTATGIAKTLELIATQEGVAIATLVDIADNVQKYGEGTVAQKLGELASKRDEAWRLVIEVVLASNYSLVRYEKNKAAGLNITAAERHGLLDELEKIFGPSVKNKELAGEKPLWVAGRMLYSIISDPKWKARDE